MSTGFFTITVSSPGSEQIQPGNLDPEIPITIAKSLYLKQVQSPQHLQTYFGTLAYGFHMQGMNMQRGTTAPWWTAPEMGDQMTYECNSKLGTPRATDCSQLLSQLGAPSDSIQVAPGAVRFLSSSKRNHLSSSLLI